MHIIKPSFRALLPLGLFLIIFIGSGIYFSFQQHPYAFYQISSVTAIIPAILMAFIYLPADFEKTLKEFIEGVRNENIIIMCLIYLLAGAFSTITEQIGSINATVNIGLQCIPSSLLLPGIFLIASLGSLAMGTSMGTIAAVTPLVIELATQVNLDKTICVGAVIGGAMFGDNLSLVSDTTIAAVTSQNANIRQKFILNLKLALPSVLITLGIYLFYNKPSLVIVSDSHNYLLISPYIIILLFSLIGMNVFGVLMSGILCATILGVWIVPGYSLVTASHSILKGCNSMQEIMVLSLLMGGLSNLMFKQGGLEWIIQTLQNFITKNNRSSSRESIEFIICCLVSLADLCVANNTVAIILCGPIVQRLRHQAKISAEWAACLMDVFSCVFQGLLPYSAQILLACSIASLSPLQVLPTVFYCPILGLITLSIIFLPYFRKLIDK